MSLIENFKDRVPTEVLSNGAVRYEQFDSNGDSLGYVYIKRADAPTEVGDIWNKVTYDGIKGAIEDRVKIEDKASTQEAQGGTNDTKYMTPQKVNDYHIQNIGIKYYDVSLQGSSSTTIDLTQYLVPNVEKLEIVFNAKLGSGDIIMYGTGITSGHSSSTSTSKKIGKGDTVAKLEIYPNSLFYKAQGDSLDGITDIIGRYATLTSVSIPATRASSTTNQVSIYQYLK